MLWPCYTALLPNLSSNRDVVCDAGLDKLYFVSSHHHQQLAAHTIFHGHVLKYYICTVMNLYRKPKTITSISYLTL